MSSPRLTVPEVASLLRCSEWAARRLMRTGQIPSALVAGRYVATERAVESYVASIEVAPVSTSTRRRRRRSAS